MAEPDIFVGVDWGSRTHQVCIVDNAGRVRDERAFEHGGRGLADLADWILEAAPPDRAVVAIEVPHGPVVESPMARQLAAHSINPKQLDCFRDRISPAGAKDDRRDDRVLADALRTDRRYSRRLDAEDPEIVALRARTHTAEDLARERNRLANRLREQLRRYYPQFLELSADLTREWVLELWTRAPTPDKARRLRKTTMQRILKRHRVRAIDADTAMRHPAQPAHPRRARNNRGRHSPHRKPRPPRGVADRPRAVACAMLQARAMFNPAYPAHKMPHDQTPLLQRVGSPPARVRDVRSGNCRRTPAVPRAPAAVERRGSP